MTLLWAATWRDHHSAIASLAATGRRLPKRLGALQICGYSS